MRNDYLIVLVGVAMVRGLTGKMSVFSFLPFVVYP
jgi:hypothetical protein